ncbi:hypothetical protein [Shinella kummerowiae]|uniref:hypothetical protein n=1 Tax=Shinella kummerowiae TaxID=417745 RepID=UPI0021B502CF|nr:hypothetical protein [Shinella kummerowiae]MCT7667531.1 hypothetical protein [Shinella kummerowiae]
MPSREQYIFLTRNPHLSDTLRRRFPGFVDDDSVPRPQSSAKAGDRDAKLADIEAEVSKLFAQSIPRHPAHNSLVLFALNTFRANNIAAVDPKDANDVSSLKKVVRTVNRRQPKIKPVSTFEPDGYSSGPLSDYVLTLHSMLQDYASIKGGDLNAFPSIETLGYRRDESGLKRRDPGPAPERKRWKMNLNNGWGTLSERELAALDVTQDDRKAIADALAGERPPPDIWVDAPADRIDDLPLRKKQLRAINKHLDERCPHGSYFNRMRQDIVHTVWSNRREIQYYVDSAEQRRRQGKLNKDGSVWVFPAARDPFEDVVKSVTWLLDEARTHLAAATPPPRPMKLADAVRIDRLVVAHREALLRVNGQEPNAEGSAEARARLASHPVSERIKRAVTDHPETIVNANADAARWAERCAETIEKIIPFENRSTLSRRINLYNNTYHTWKSYVSPAAMDGFIKQPQLLEAHLEAIHANLAREKTTNANLNDAGNRRQWERKVHLEQLALELHMYDIAAAGALKRANYRSDPSNIPIFELGEGEPGLGQKAGQNKSWGTRTFDLSDSEDSDREQRPRKRPRLDSPVVRERAAAGASLPNTSWAAPALDLSDSEDESRKRPHGSSPPAGEAPPAKRRRLDDRLSDGTASRNTVWAAPALDLSDSEDEPRKRPYESSSPAGEEASAKRRKLDDRLCGDERPPRGRDQSHGL